MQTASIKEIKNALGQLSTTDLTEICLLLAKYKQENKELLTYLIFESDNQALFIKQVKEEIDQQFLQMNPANVYLAKKTIRKVLRTTQKFIRFSRSRQTEAELLIYFCQKLKASTITINNYPVLRNLYNRQLDKIRKATAALHEDLQYDYGEQIENL